MEKHVVSRSVREAMTASPKTVRAETTIPELLRLFEKHDFNGFPVVEGHDHLVGMVTKLDVLRVFRTEKGLFWPRGVNLSAERVIDIMSRGIIAVEANDWISHAVDLMVDYRLHSLPVIDNAISERRLVGIVSRQDLLGWLVAEEDPRLARA